MKVLRRKALMQHAGNCMPAHITVCDLFVRARMCRNGATTIVVTAPRELPTKSLAQKPAHAQRAASRGGSGTCRTALDGSRVAAMVESAPSRRGSGAGGAARAAAAARALLAHRTGQGGQQGSGRPGASKRQKPRRLAAGRHSGGSGGGGETPPLSQEADEPSRLRQEVQDGAGGGARRWSGMGTEDRRQGGAGHACKPCRAVPALRQCLYCLIVTLIVCNKT